MVIQLMKKGLAHFCDDNFLIQSSQEENEENCLKFCSSTGDQGDSSIIMTG